MARNIYRILNLHFNISNNLLKRTTNTPNIRLYATASIKKPESEAPVYTKTDHEYRISKKATVQTLEELLNVKTLKALHIISQNEYFARVSRATLKNNCKLFLQKGITYETLHKYPEILTIPDAKMKAKELEKLPYNINATAVLLLLSMNKFMKLIYSEAHADKKRSKISTLSSLLNIDQQKACECLAKKSFVISLPTSKIETNIKLLLEYGIHTDDICSDLWVLRYSEELIKARLGIAKERNVDNMKTWMVRAKEDVFQTYLQRRSDQKSILGNCSLVEYISERLQCSVALANYVIMKQPALQNKSLKKLNEIIDFLYSQGFEPHQISRVPKILVHSIDTIRKRLKQLEDKGIQIDSLSMLTKSQNQFMQYYEALIKSKNKAKTKT